MTPTTVLVVDDHALFRDGLTALISRWDDFVVVGTAADGAEAIRLARSLRPGLILMDVRMEPVGGVEATAAITTADPDVRVVMLTMSSLGEDVYQALRNGAHGYLSKDERADRLHEYLAGLMRGEAAMSSTIAARVLAEFGLPGGSGTPIPPAHERLTHRERDVLRFLVDGLSNEEIAQQLFLSEATVKKHLGSIMTKLHVRNRVQVAVFGVRQGIVH
ncbi:response regulator transcription factor [Cellulomonas sp. NTE-D12]|uniref:response regulator n=1 Tax=Cellulomonas sp. NTE-D12 TaxID=2962632 RepID=UPI003081A84E|nr:DNA-binding response regulator [Cellulomonas sp. NTE-D12]